ncbi:disulfide bond formation protein B [Photobacterium kishitanii]|uniref:Disulfide bond formation protein B n=1 Tax=Photobacterium kishitanii TaxID=318456 RepID=A0A2T3KE25_9GAMM|nr:disulfide bond formation protein B [Photobacterium kishitanii]KJG07308.1 disulfide bond formation protein B [Photobacterium kishitanii]KJG55565.1 disulfide bond formation protein B [Photobacterium kishitanii]KJG60118.1 disulfide bond formation protein B [Photobacterium kishitanii]KJG63813.1 disulfide bond formation protein B [Photobacterium kishitanii]KJG67066.1 disulfide bond formation protein B [Photobacterium kishitanii]
MNNKNVALLNALGLLGITFVLLMASVLQVVLNELPCPLCLLQRLGFMLVMFGFMLNVVYGPQQRHYGILIIGALFGAATALRQVSLHVIPGTPGFGSPVFGIHYYTWAFILFSLTIVGVAVLQLLWNKDWNNNDYKMNRFGKFVCLVAIFAVVVNVVSTFIECGPYQCPDNPVTYWLFN